MTWVNTCQSQFCCLLILLQTDDSPAFEFVVGGGWQSRKKGLLPHISFLVSVNVVHGDEIYSLVYHIQQELEPAAGETWDGMFFFFPKLLSVPEPRRQSVALLGNMAVFVLRADCRVTVVTWKLTFVLKLCQVEPIAVLTACFTWPIFNGNPKMSASAEWPYMPPAALHHGCRSRPILCMVGPEKERGIKCL